MADDNIRHVNYASDFRVVFSFPDGRLPDYPWRIELKTPDTPAYNTYVASFDGSVYRRCVPLEDNSILVLVDRHHLAPGTLCYQMKRDVPDALFPDGEMNITTPGCTSIELWSGTSEELPIEQINTIIATLKGEPGDAGQIENITASVNNTTGAPNVEVQLGGTPEKRTIALKFSGIKGETPQISADEEGNIYSDGELVTAVVAEVVVKADTSAANADLQAARAKSLADHPPKIVDVGGAQILGFLGRCDQRLRNLGIPGGRRHYRAAGRWFCRFAGCQGRDDVRLRRTDLAEYCERRELDEAVNHPLHVGRYGYAVLLSGGLQHHGLDEARGEQELHHLHLVRCGQHDLR